MALGYIFVGCALTAGLIKGYCGKRSSVLVSTYRGSMLSSLVRMLICMLVGILIVSIGGLASLRVDAGTLLFAALSGVASAGAVVSWLISARNGSYMLLEVFNLLSVIFNVVLCRLLFGVRESISVFQWIAMVLLVLSSYIMFGYSKTIKKRVNARAFLILAIGAISTGLMGVSKKGFVYHAFDGNGAQLNFFSSAVFNFYTYCFAALTILIAFLIASATKEAAATDAPSPAREVFRPRTITYIAIMAVGLFAHSYFETCAAAYLGSAQLYPITQGGGLLLSMLLAAVFFGERINLRCIVSMLLSVTALVLTQF